MASIPIELASAEPSFKLRCTVHGLRYQNEPGYWLVVVTQKGHWLCTRLAQSWILLGSQPSLWFDSILRPCTVLYGQHLQVSAERVREKERSFLGLAYSPWGKFRKYVWFWGNQKIRLGFYNGCLWEIDVSEQGTKLRLLVSKIIL